MNNFWFTWANTSGQIQQWSFLDGGNYFELPPHSSRVEENQYDLGDRSGCAAGGWSGVTHEKCL